MHSPLCVTQIQELQNSHPPNFTHIPIQLISPEVNRALIFFTLISFLAPERHINWITW